MGHRGRQLCSLMTALAVLLVGVTCSSAGCLLQLTPSHEKLAHPCCDEGMGDGQLPASPEDQGERCPLCHNSILINKTVEKSSLDGKSQAPCPIYITVLPTSCLTPSTSSPVKVDSNSYALTQSSTLLGLHCALLN